MLPLRVRVDLGAMAVKGYSTFSKAEASLSDSLMSYPRRLLGRSDLSAEMQLVYSTVPENWAKDSISDYYMHLKQEYWCLS